MVYGFVLVLHLLVAFILIGIVLIQGGRGGLSEALGGTAAQSLFGGNTVTVLTRITAACAAIFGLTCLLLAYLSTVRGRSVVDQIPVELPAGLPLASPNAVPEAPLTAPLSAVSNAEVSHVPSPETSGVPQVQTTPRDAASTP